ncbi:MAG: MoaD/ThiS family protein [Myxococcota bacterium]
MAKVVIPTIFQGPTRGESELDVDFGTIGACFDAVDAEFPGLKALVVDPKGGAIHKFVKVTLNGELLNGGSEVLERAVSASDEIEIIAAIAGG